MNQPSLRRRALADDVYEAILDQLIDGRVAPGSHFNVDGWARSMDVSTTPIREALARLERTGLVRRAAHKGYEVTELMSPTDVAHHVQARMILEPDIVQIAYDHSGPDLLAALEDALSQHREARSHLHDPKAFRRYWDADESFHRLLASYSGNPYLVASYDSIASQAQRYRLYALTGFNDADDAIAEHAAVLKCLRDGDTDGAAAAMRTHLDGVRERAVRSLQSLS